MANETVLLRIVTPAGIALEARVTEVTLPGSDGQIGILPGHIRYTGLIGIGVMSFKTEQAATEQVVISGGFAQFVDGVLSVVADSVDQIDTVDREGYGVKRSELQRLLDVEDSRTPRWGDARDQLSRIEAIDRLLAS